jgi:hypothetical protein
MHRACLIVIVAVLLVLPGESAFGLSGPVLLGFAEGYVAPDASTCTHHGVDVGMAAGALVDTPMAGDVRFVGHVPGPQGGSVLAVTIETAQGRMTMLPLEDAGVSEGDHLEAGAAIGHVAAKGDASSATPHLHIGLKRGGVYVDPSPLLAVPAPPTQPAPEPEVAYSTSEAKARPAPSTAPAAAVAPSSVAKPAGEAAGSPALGTGAQIAEASAGDVAADGQLAPGVSLVPVASQSPALSSGTVPGAGVLSVSEASARRPLAASGNAGASGTTFTEGALAPSLGLLAAGLFCSAVLITRKALTRRVAARGPVSDRLGILLQHLKAGDTICGLTSCPGPLPSQSRGH